MSKLSDTEKVEEIVNKWLECEKVDNYVSELIGTDNLTSVILDGTFDVNELITQLSALLEKKEKDIVEMITMRKNAILADPLCTKREVETLDWIFNELNNK
jgi:hypothetical protein